jgi:predicted DNA-binding protein (UPF0251 family)
MTYEIDYIAPEHLGLHKRLINWARYVTPSRSPSLRSPIYSKAKSNWRQWHVVEHKDPVDELDGDLVEHTVAKLPAAEREALRWYYVRTYEQPQRFCRRLKISRMAIGAILQTARAYLLWKLQQKPFDVDVTTVR